MKNNKRVREDKPEPTKAELAVLQVLWRQGALTVRMVHDALNEGKESTQYTSSLKLMQVMTEKGMLARDETNMKHVYRAVLEERGTKGHLLNKFIDTMYQGSVGSMMLALLGNEKTSGEDLQKVKELLAELEKKNEIMIQVICRVLIHSLWQGALLTAAAGSVVLFTKRSAAAVRYRLLCVLFFLFLTGSGMTFLYELYSGDGVGDGDGWSGAAGSLLPVVTEISRYCSDHAVAIVTAWFIIVSVKCARLAIGWSYAQRIRRDGLVAPGGWARKVRSLSRQLGIRRRVMLLESRLARVPIVIGHLRPVIFVPLGLLNHLPAAEMEAVILHELAHIRRHDYLVNFLQHIAESLFFFNPGVLWLSSLLREERENCCDDMAILRTNDRVGFVRALVRFKEHALRADSALADSAFANPALAFPAGKHQLLQRVLRITHQQNKTLSGGERVFFMGSCLLAIVLLVSVSGGLTATGNGYSQINQERSGALKGPPLRYAGGQRADEELQNTGRVDRTEDMAPKGQEKEMRERLLKSLEKETREELLKRNEQEARGGGLMNPEQEAEEGLSRSGENEAKEGLVKKAVQQSLESASRDREVAELSFRLSKLNMDKAQQDAQKIRQMAQQAEQIVIRAERDKAGLDLDLRKQIKEKQQAEREMLQALQNRARAELNRKQAGMEKDQIQAPKER